MEDAELTRQEEERAQQLLPDAHARFKAALQALPADQTASPSVQPRGMASCVRLPTCR
ncbi:hypothetical protein [Nonomuraea angiospora]|uniref:hypothetical protein n=1 Tax=Nonomuraea angiospora TaxID=46172 RepID=UPI0029B9188D|nr:hypothetical protein [Nonomuraea angiospora]MDX3102069.1 hypothetical protein [Nonomuraea angiospora]